jgi:hypothetical protein
VKVVSVLVALCLVAFAAVATADPVAAATCPGGGSVFEGLDTNPITTDGTEAEITLWNPAFCNTTIAWVMMVNKGEAKWAQSGYGHGDGCPWSWGCYFTQRFSPTTGPVTTWGWQIQSPLPYPVSNRFTVYQDGGSRIRMLVNGYEFDSYYASWQAHNSQWMGETARPPAGDRFVGSYGLKVTFSSLKHLYQGTWYSDNPASNVVADSSYGEYVSFHTNAFQIWDIRN